MLQSLGRCKDTARRCREEVSCAVRMLRETLHTQLETLLRRIEEYEDMIERASRLTSTSSAKVQMSAELAYYVDAQKAVEGIQGLCLFSRFSIQEDKAVMTSPNSNPLSDPQAYVLYANKPVKVEQTRPRLSPITDVEVISDDSP